MDHYQQLKEAGYVEKTLGRSKNDHRDRDIFYGLFPAAEMKLCYKIDKYGIQNKKTALKGYRDTE